MVFFPSLFSSLLLYPGPHLRGPGSGCGLSQISHLRQDTGQQRLGNTCPHQSEPAGGEGFAGAGAGCGAGGWGVVFPDRFGMLVEVVRVVVVG